MAVLHESTFKRLTIHGALAPVIQQFLLIDAVLILGLEALAVHRQREHDPFQRVDAWSLLPYRTGRAAVQAARVAGVGGRLRRLQIGAFPAATATLLPRLLLGALFQRTNRRFDRP